MSEAATSLPLQLYLTMPQRVGSSTLQQRFESFHKLNPSVERLIVSIADEMLGHGVQYLGSKMIF